MGIDTHDVKDLISLRCQKSQGLIHGLEQFGELGEVMIVGGFGFDLFLKELDWINSWIITVLQQPLGKPHASGPCSTHSYSSRFWAFVKHTDRPGPKPHTKLSYPVIRKALSQIPGGGDSARLV
mgnify:FL=1